jgi:hypothetical protein
MSVPRPCWQLSVYEATFCRQCRRMCIHNWWAVDHDFCACSISALAIVRQDHVSRCMTMRHVWTMLCAWLRQQKKGTWAPSYAHSFLLFRNFCWKRTFVIDLRAVCVAWSVRDVYSRSVALLTSVSKIWGLLAYMVIAWCCVRFLSDVAFDRIWCFRVKLRCAKHGCVFAERLLACQEGICPVELYCRPAVRFLLPKLAILSQTLATHRSQCNRWIRNTSMMT